MFAALLATPPRLLPTGGMALHDLQHRPWFCQGYGQRESRGNKTTQKSDILPSDKRASHTEQILFQSR